MQLFPGKAPTLLHLLLRLLFPPTLATCGSVQSIPDMALWGLSESTEGKTRHHCADLNRNRLGVRLRRHQISTLSLKITEIQIEGMGNDLRSVFNAKLNMYEMLLLLTFSLCMAFIFCNSSSSSCLFLLSNSSFLSLKQH